MGNHKEQVENSSQTVELESMFEQLEGIIAQLEGEEVSLEQSFSLYHDGMEKIKKCNESIDVIEKKVQLIDQNGVFHEF